jgi:hypothetical protein
VELPQSQHVSDDATTAHAPTERGHDPESRRIPTVDSASAQLARHSLADEFPSRREEEKQEPHELVHRNSEPVRKPPNRRHLHYPAASPPPHTDPAMAASPGAASNPSIARLLPTSAIQDSPDPLTPGEDHALHSLDMQAPSQQQSEAEGGGRANVASAPAVLGKRFTQLSAATAATPAGTWHEHIRGQTMFSTASIEEEMYESDFSEFQAQAQDGVQLAHLSTDALSIGETSLTHPVSVELPAPGSKADRRGDDAGFPSDQSTFRDTMSGLDPGSTAPTSLPSQPSQPSQPRQPDQEVAQNPQEQQALPDGESKPAGKAGREEGWGTSFKIKWIQKNPLPFSRTRHLRNPWNHDVRNSLLLCYPFILPSRHFCRPCIASEYVLTFSFC